MAQLCQVQARIFLLLDTFAAVHALPMDETRHRAGQVLLKGLS